MGTYNNTFGGNFIQPSTISYNNIVLGANVNLSWPTTYQDTPGDYVLASYMTVQASVQAPIVFNLEADPLTTENGSSVVTVTVDSTINLFPGTPITIDGATETNNITAEELNITANILGIEGGDSFTYTSNGTADGNGDGGGNNVMLTYNVPYCIILPDATQVSTGTPLQFINNGENTFFIADNGKNFLVTLGAGNVYQLLLTDNSTPAGQWQILPAGTGTASSNAYQISGLGLKTINGTLNTNFPSKIVSGNYTSTAGDRSSLIVWNGGVGTINLMPDAPIGFFESINNSGSGILSVAAGDNNTIDGKGFFQLQPGDSCQFIKTSSNTWNSLGFGKETFFSITTFSRDIGDGGTINLTNDEASRTIQIYTGALLNDAVITFPPSTGQWYIWNNTSNNYTVTLKLFGVEGGFLIPQGQKLIVYSDGINLYSTPTTATNAIFNPGNEGSPTIVFTNDATTGFYNTNVGSFGFSSGGNLSLDFASYGLGAKGGKETRFYNANNSFYASLKANDNISSNITWALPLVDATNAGQIIYSNAEGLLSFTETIYPTSTEINQILYSSAENTVSGLETVNNGILVTNEEGIPSITQEPLGVPLGGSGLATLTIPYGVICAGTTPTGNFQNIGAGEIGQVVISNGGQALPSFQSYLPRGTIIEYAGTVDLPINSGWLECNGQAVSRVTYAGLFVVIGIIYGAGDGNTTFNVPDKRGRTSVGIGSDNSTGGRITNATAPNIALGATGVFGSETHTLTVPEMPPHNHGLTVATITQGASLTNAAPTAYSRDDVFTSSVGGGQPHNNTQPSIFMRYYIRWL